MPVGQRVEEQFRGLSALGVMEQLIASRLTQQLGDERIGMVGAEIASAGLQGIYLFVMIEESGHFQVTLVARDGIKRVHGFIVSAELIADHAPPRGLIDRTDLIVCPQPHALGDG